MNHADKMFHKFLEEYSKVHGPPTLMDSLMMEQAFMNGIVAGTAPMASKEISDAMKIVATTHLRKNAEEVCNKRMCQASGGRPDGN